MQWANDAQVERRPIDEPGLLDSLRAQDRGFIGAFFSTRCPGRGALPPSLVRCRGPSAFACKLYFIRLRSCHLCGCGCLERA